MTAIPFQQQQPQLPKQVDVLVLGAGWLSQFLLPLLTSSSLTYIATTRSGDSHYPDVPLTHPLQKFAFDPKASKEEVGMLFGGLPKATVVLVTFPLVGGSGRKLIEGWKEAHGESNVTWVALGSTGVWQADPSLSSSHPQIFNRHSPINPSNARGAAENEFLDLSVDGHSTIVLNLAGLYGGERVVRNWIARVAGDKEALRKKGGVHLIHGEDVSVCIVRLVQQLDLLPESKSTSARRFIISDGRVYDWWDLASSLPILPDAEPRKWVRELMREEDVPVLPRSTGQLGRVLDARDFWEIWGVSPQKRLE